MTKKSEIYTAFYQSDTSATVTVTIAATVTVTIGLRLPNLAYLYTTAFSRLGGISARFALRAQMNLVHSKQFVGRYGCNFVTSQEHRLRKFDKISVSGIRPDSY